MSPTCHPDLRSRPVRAPGLAGDKSKKQMLV